jgi:hypothetical protein
MGRSGRCEAGPNHDLAARVRAARIDPCLFGLVYIFKPADLKPAGIFKLC